MRKHPEPAGVEADMQAKDLDDRAVIREVIAAGGVDYCHWAMWWDLQPVFPDVPWGVLVAKVRALNRRGLLDACVHNGKVQCRGDIWVTESGYAYLATDEGRKGCGAAAVL